MSQTRLHDALILVTHDVGEADRFCILFTREAGKRAARARGVRKPGSRLGGVLLPQRHVRLEVREGSGGVHVTAAVDVDVSHMSHTHFLPFARMSEGTELLLRLVEDDEPLPRVFDLLLVFRAACAAHLPNPVLPFTLRLLHHLGLLPTMDEDYRFQALSLAACAFVRACAAEQIPFDHVCALPYDAPELARFCDLLLHDHLTRPLRSREVGEQLVA